jgi:hypothetical protein
MQPSSSNLQYAVKNIPDSFSASNWKVNEINTDYNFGFDVGLTTHFHHANSNISLNWQHFHSSDSDSKFDDDSANNYTPLFNVLEALSLYQETFGKNKFYLDEINLNYGTLLNLGSLINLRLFAGVGFSRLKQNLVSKFYDPSHLDTLKIHSSSTFNGAGPEVGFNFNQKIVAGLSLSGMAKTALLIGAQKNHTTYYSTSIYYDLEELPNPLKQKIEPESKSHLIPTLDGSLGLSYLINFCKHYMINVEAGYRAQIYID